MALREVFRENVRQRRIELGWTQVELAKRLNVTQPYVAEIERGRATPGLDTVERFADALGIDADLLLRRRTMPQGVSTAS